MEPDQIVAIFSEHGVEIESVDDVYKLQCLLKSFNTFTLNELESRLSK
jgi:hypothetical protein